MARKTRSDAHPLDKYREDLDQWLYVDNLSYKECVAELEVKHGCKISTAALWRWKQDRDEDRLIEKIARDARRTNDAVEAFSAQNPQLDAAFTNLLKQVAFNIVSEADPNPEAIMMVAGHALKLRDQELKAREVALKEDAFKQRTCELFLKWYEDKRAREVADGKASNSDKIAVLRQMMFADVAAAVGKT